MKSRLSLSLAAATFALIALAGCSSPAADTDTGSSAGSDSSDSNSTDTESSAPAEAAELTVADSTFGSIVVGADGMTVYMFDKDTAGSGASVCAGECATNWPAVTTDSTDPVVDGVTGEIGTITGTDGKTQVTLNGWPLYYFAGDKAAGDTAGQGVGTVWWVLSPAGDKIAS